MLLSTPTPPTSKNPNIIHVLYTLPIWSVQFTEFWYVHRVLQPSQLSNSKTFPSPPKEISCLLVVTITLPHPTAYTHQPQATSNLFSDSMDLPILDISYRRNHTIYSLSVLAFLTKHEDFKVHLCCNMYQCFIPLCGYIAFPFMAI